MSGNLMDTNPVPSPLPETPPAAGEAALPPAPSFVTKAHREFPLRDVFVDEHGLYPGTRLLIYLAMGGALLYILPGLLRSAHPHGLWLMVSSELSISTFDRMGSVWRRSMMPLTADSGARSSSRFALIICYLPNW